MLSAESWTLIPAGAPFYTPDTGIGLGVYAIMCPGLVDVEESVLDRSEPGSPNQGTEPPGASKPRKQSEVVFFFSGTQNLQFSVGAQPEWYVNEDQYRIGGYMELSHYPGEWWGLGSGSLKGNVETYEPSTLVWKGSIYRTFHSSLYVGPRFSFRYSEIEGGPLVTAMRGGAGGRALGVGFGGVWDSRDSSFNPAKGVLADGFFELYRTGWGSDWNYGVFQLDIRGYVSMGKTGVLALQGKIQTAWGDVPFLSYPSLGGSVLMRGYPMGRFQDLTSLAVQGEYRFLLIGNVGGVVFLGAGDVAPSLPGYFSGSTPKIVGGFGIRFQIDPQRRINARLDVGFTAEGMGVYVLVKEAF